MRTTGNPHNVELRVEKILPVATVSNAVVNTSRAVSLP
jgi:hypothetical protein